MFNIFNMGIGMVIAMPAADAEKAIAILAKHGDKAQIIGKVIEGENEIL
jgi:phosphoribosylformylglycinamidine cyclo-ligase